MKCLLFLGALALPAIAAAQTAPPPPRVDAEAHPGQTICRSMANTGSRLSRTRVCMTRAEWAERRREMQDALARTQSNRRPTGT
jgi:hypothetical protein